MKQKLLAAAVALSGAMFALTAASAATLNPAEISCDTENFSGSTSCRINLGDNNGGNVTVSGLNNSVFGTFLSTDNPTWIELGALDANQPGGSPFSVDYSNGSPFGWSLALGFMFDPLATYAFAIKSAAGPAVAPDAFNVVYLMDNAVSSGSFNTSDLAQGFSNIRLFGTQRLTNVPPPPPTNPVPLPAAGWMLLAGIGGLAAWGRRRRAAA
jgi:hypothetical protein